MPTKKPLNTQPTNRLLDVSTLANSPYEKIFNPQSENIPIQQSNVINKTPIVPQRQIQRVPSAIPNQNVILNAGIQLIPEEQMPKESNDDSSNFLGSLIAQGIAGIGTGLMGGDSYAIQRSASMFQGMRDKQENERKAKLLMDPKSEESKKQRLVYKSLGYDVPDNLSYTDLRDPVVLQSIRNKNMQAIAPKGGISGARGGSETQIKEEKSDKKSITDYVEHAQSLQSSINVIKAIKNLNRKGYDIFPDTSSANKLYSGTIDREAQPQVKVLAGPGSVTDAERSTFLNYVPNSNMRKDVAIGTTQNIVLEGTNKALSKLNLDKSLGKINSTDYEKIINEYNKYLLNPDLELNKRININTGQIEDATTDFNSLQ